MKKSLCSFVTVSLHRGTFLSTSLIPNFCVLLPTDNLSNTVSFETNLSFV